MNTAFWPILGAFLSAAISVYGLKSITGRLMILDLPNERSLHSIPTPRTGGLGIWIGWLLGALILTLLLGLQTEIVWTACAALLVGTISFVDDRAHVPVIFRFVIHLLAAGLLIAGGFASSLWWPGSEGGLPMGLVLLLSLFYIVWMTNLYNFMDGMDGLAGGMATIGFGTLGLLGYLADEGYYAVTCWVIAAASTGFLIWNFPPASIFMGDVGSSGLGFLVAAMSLWAAKKGISPLWLSVLVFSPFIVDATVTLMRRILQGKKIWQPHRDHYYQRLVQAGWSHRRTALWEYALMLLCSLCACVAYQSTTLMQWMILGGVAGIYVLAIISVHAVEKHI